MRVIERIKNVFKNTKTIFKNNKEVIDKHNQQIVPRFLLISAIIMVVPLIFSIFRLSMHENVLAYLITFGAVIILYILSNIKSFKKYILVFAYSLGLIYFVLANYLSLVQFDTRPAGTLLTFFVVVPLIAVDRSYRINIFVIMMFIFHTVASYQIKGATLGSIDFLNTFVSVTLGILFGRLFLLSYLNTFEMRRLLTIEKETDFLTSLSNRRKLYQDVELLQKLKNTKIGILMIDIDNFKSYNDKFGHLEGDKLLVEFSEMLLSLEKDNQTKFYRYGGEEFVGVTINMTKDELINFAENIRIKTTTLENKNSNLTISVGISKHYNNSNSKINETISNADNALFEAKQNGRNCVKYIFSSRTY